MATKALARQLGLIRRKSIAPANESLGRRRLKQLFDYLIVIDFESTCWNDGKRHQTQEIIEFPAVLLNTSTGEMESEFHAYVQPQEHPVLSDFCMKLTGIKQAQVEEGVPLKICLSQFCKWIQKIQQQKKMIFATGVSDLSTSEVKLCAFVTWSDCSPLLNRGACKGDLVIALIMLLHSILNINSPRSAHWDLGVCLEYECKRKQLFKPVFLNSWIDLRVTYKIFYRRKPKGLSGALQEVGIEFVGREHSGLDDSRNTALLAWKMIRDGCLLKITRSLNKVPTKKDPNVLARHLNTNQVEETSACNSSIQEPKNTIYYLEKVQTRSVGVNSIKIQQNALQPKSRVGLRNVTSCSSLPSPQPSTCLGQPQCPSFRTPVHKQIKNERRAFHTKSESATRGSELVLVSTTLSSVNHVSDVEMSSALDCLPMLADWEDVALLPASQPEQKTDCLPAASDSDSAPSSNAGERLTVLEESELLSYGNFGGTETPQKSESSKSIVYRSPHTTIYDVKEANRPSSDVSNFKLPECKSSSLNSVKASMAHPSVLGKGPLGGADRSSPSPPAFPLAKKHAFAIHAEVPRSREAPPSVLTPPAALRLPWRPGKMTPPLCQCGRRSKRLVVSNNGPNHGRAFYCCPTGKYQENRKCGFFKWEHALQQGRADGTGRCRPSGALALSSAETSQVCARNEKVSPNHSLRLRPSMRN